MKFDMGAAWQDAVAMIGANKEVLMVVAGIFFFLPALVQAMLVPQMTDVFAQATDPEQMQALILELYRSWGWLFALTFLFSLVGYLALLALLRDSSRPTVGEAIKAGFVGVLPSFAAYLLYVFAVALVGGLLMGVGAALQNTALAIVLGIVALVFIVYTSVKVSLSAPVIALERVYNPVKILQRSWQLTKGNSLRLFGFFLLIIVVYMVVSLVVGMVASLIILAFGPDAGLAATGIVSAFIGTGVAIVFVAVLAAIHRQLAGPSSAAVSETFE